MANKRDQEKLSDVLSSINNAKQGKSENDNVPKPDLHVDDTSNDDDTTDRNDKHPGATAIKFHSPVTPDASGQNEQFTTNDTEHNVELKELKRFLTNPSGIDIFLDNSTDYLNGDMTVKKYPDLLSKLPYLPDLKTVIKQDFTSADNNPYAFDVQLQAMLNRERMNSRHSFSLMLPQYVRVAIDTIANVGNSQVYKNYPSLVAFKERYGDGKITRSSLLFAILGGVFKPDVDLQKRFLGEVLSRNRSRSQIIMKDLLRYRTLTPDNYDWSGRDTTSFNFPNNFGAVLTIAMIKYLTDRSDFFSDDSLQGLIRQDMQRGPQSKSLSKNMIYQGLEQYLNLRLLINTKLQHVLFDGLKSHTDDDVKR